VIDVLIDTGSDGLGVPISPMPGWKNFQVIDLAEAEGTILDCHDHRCKVRLTTNNNNHNNNNNYYYYYYMAIATHYLFGVLVRFFYHHHHY